MNENIFWSESIRNAFKHILKRNLEIKKIADLLIFCSKSPKIVKKRQIKKILADSLSLNRIRRFQNVFQNEKFKINFFPLQNFFCALIIFWPKLAQNVSLRWRKSNHENGEWDRIYKIFMSGVCGTEFSKNVLITSDKNATWVFIGI